MEVLLTQFAPELARVAAALGIALLKVAPERVEDAARRPAVAQRCMTGRKPVCERA